MKPCLLTFLLLALAKCAFAFKLPTIIKVPPRYSFNIYWPAGVTNVGYVTNWTSPSLSAGSNWFCVRTSDRGTNESDCVSVSFTNTVALPKVTLIWDLSNFPVPPPLTNIAMLGTDFESSTNLKDWTPAFSTTDKSLTNLTPNTIYYRVKATIK